MTPQKKSAFTLIELLTVIAIIGILAAIIIPTVGRVRASARTAQCASNLRQIGVGLLTYANENKQKFPHVFLSGQHTSWQVTVSPYLGLGGRIGPDPLPRADGVLLCPAFTYGQNGRNVPYGYNRNITLAPWGYRSNLPNPSRVFLVVEMDYDGDLFLPSAHGNDVPRRHPGGNANFLFADGHVQPVTGLVPYAAPTASGGDPRWNLEPR